MISKRTAEMTSFIVMDVLERANEMERAGNHIIYLEVGEPDLTPLPVSKRRPARPWKMVTLTIPIVSGMSRAEGGYLRILLRDL